MQHSYINSPIKIEERTEENPAHWPTHSAIPSRNSIYIIISDYLEIGSNTYNYLTLAQQKLFQKALRASVRIIKR
jgi:hypothetical protein